MFLEAQFGATNITPIAHPKLPDAASATTTTDNADSTHKAVSIAGGLLDAGDDEFSPEEQAELKRLHGLGIPVPGVLIKVDKLVARVWLETLDVECPNGVLRDRVRAVVDRAVETVAPIWRE